MVQVRRGQISSGALLRDEVRPQVYVKGHRIKGVMEWMDGVPGPAERIAGFEDAPLASTKQESWICRLSRWIAG